MDFELGKDTNGDEELLGRHPAVASFFAHLPTFLRTYPLPAPAGDNYLVPPFSRFSCSAGIRRRRPIIATSIRVLLLEKIVERRQVMNELAACSQYAQAHQERLSGKQVFGSVHQVVGRVILERGRQE